MKELKLLKVITVKNVWCATIGFFFNRRFKFQDSVCNVCQTLTMLCLSLGDIVIIIVKNVDYYCIIHNISKSDTIHLLEYSVLDDRGYI